MFVAPASARGGTGAGCFCRFAVDELSGPFRSAEVVGGPTFQVGPLARPCHPKPPGGMCAESRPALEGGSRRSGGASPGTMDWWPPL